MASVAPARPTSLRRKPSPSHAKAPQTPPCARFRPHPRRTITAPHRSRPASIPIAPAAPPATTSRDFVPWALIRRRPPGRVDGFVIPRPRNLVWGFGSQAENSRHVVFSFNPNFFVRLESPFLRPDPQRPSAVARRGCQDWPSLQSLLVSPAMPGHTLTAPSTAARSLWSR
jgi:hypothetical protein